MISFYCNTFLALFRIFFPFDYSYSLKRKFVLFPIISYLLCTNAPTGIRPKQENSDEGYQYPNGMFPVSCRASVIPSECLRSHLQATLNTPLHAHIDARRSHMMKQNVSVARRYPRLPYGTCRIR